MNRAGYTYGDIHHDNIMCDETLSTWYLIDYGSIFHKSFTRGATDMWWDGNMDAVGLIWDFISNPMTTYNIKFPKYRDFIKMVRKDKRYHEIKAAAPKKLLVGTDVIALITALMHYDLYIKCIGQENTDIGRHHMKYKIPNRQSYLAALEKLK
jgi:hypothetical protein